MNFQSIYREDVVIHKENMIGIVIRVAGDSDSDSSISDEGDDKDENGDNKVDSGFDMNNIDVDFGNTNSNENEDDGNTFYDCSDEKCIPLPSDHVRVAWLDGSEATLKFSDVTVKDRRFLHGDFVTLASEPTGQIGVVVDVHLCVDLESSDGFSLKDAPSKDLKRVREFAIGDYVVLGTWLGRVDDVLDNVTVLFDDGSVCKVIKADPSQLKPVGNDAVMDVCFPYYPGQPVQASSSMVFKSSMWMSGSWKTGKLEGTVINVTAASLFIYWLSTSGCGPDSLTAPAEEQSPNKIFKVLSCFSHTNWQLGDRCFLPEFYMRSGLSKAEINVSLANGEDCGQTRTDSFTDTDTGKTDVSSSEVDMTYMDQECSNGESKHFNDFLSNSKESFLQTWSIHRKKLQRSVVRRDKKTRRKEESYACALLIGNTKTTIDVLWQDGKLECGIGAVGLIPLENPGDHEFVPEQYVMDRGSDENGDDRELRRTGVVRSVNALERTANVRWVNPGSANENSQVFEGEEVVSVYELEGHPDYDYCYGDVVVRLSHSTASSAETSLINNSSDNSKLKDDLSDADHHISHIKNNKSELETSMESILSWIGNITNLKDGFIEVTWADGVVSMVGPQAVFVVGRDEDESTSEESNNDDTDSWETVNSDETTISVKPEQPMEVPSASNGVLSIPMSALGVVAKLATGIFSCGRKDSLSPVGKAASEFSSNDSEITSENTACGESALTLDSVKTNLSQQIREMEYDHEVTTPNVSQRSEATSPVHHPAQVPKFKHFDSANDPSDHYFVGISEQGSTGKQWFKKVQQDWSILQNNLPDGIYVRVYEDRMDLLRVAIVGPCGTPYQDGLFFFDFHLPSGYPNVPPSAHYHSGGWRINPNLYEEGKVCLSLLNTWTGRGNEVWDPLSSSILQILVSLQGLVLNSRPYFNEAGYDKQIGTAEGEKNSVSYNENTFLLNCKTMTYVMRKPPKDFESLVREHFEGAGLHILKACDTYMKGYSIGSLTKEGLAGEGSQGNATSVGFKLMLSKIIPKLVLSLTQVGVDCQEFEHDYSCQTKVQP